MLIKLLITFLMILILSCSSNSSKSDSQSTSIKNEKTENNNIISVDKVEELLQDKSTVFIDNRPNSKFNSGHIKGAINLPFFAKDDSSNFMTKENLLEALGDKKTVVFYCTGMNRAKNALLQAKEWEINAKLYWYQGGFTNWSESGKPIQK
ncbi:rhodanese-like domain-containing protein [bacterium]|nr:rhodanese-like domain-containing protein [bacterium]